ncbi:hypothetical protein CLIB1444_06S01882 [[Candida] jaroonii]|uniref:Uncharacterized protein n=1 Tax=[Candida] jaroonii TaxID=467808 RepID=A0ACA9YAH4_9ASCO|nr:hypothetical protein CLIB1444_06S01882 [[Candida] jaroonii]
MGPPILQMVKLLFDPDVSKKMILQLAYKQAKAVGFLKILSFLLGASIVGASTIIKIPQIKKILNPKLLEDRIKVSQGLSLNGISLETFNYLIHVLYNRNNGNSFLGYGEVACLGVQNVVIMLLINYYEKRATLENTTLSDKQKIRESLGALVNPIGIIVAIVVLFDKILPHSVINGLQVLNIPLSIISKLPQIQRNYYLKSTKHLSNITVTANVLGSLSRVFTTVQDFNKLGRDYVLLTGYSVSFILNSVVAGQCYYYSQPEFQSESEKRD